MARGNQRRGIMKKALLRLRTLLRYRELFFQLISRDIKVKYRKSLLGYFWSVLNPLLTMIVMVIVFSNIFARGMTNFPVYLLIGQMLFSFMATATSRSLTSVVDNATLLKKIYVPKYIFTLSVVTSELVTFFFTMGALLVVIIFTGTPITWRYVFIIIPIIELYVFCIGLGLFLAQATVFFRDAIYLWGVFTTAWVYFSAIFYPITILPDMIQYIVTHYNPLYFYIAMFRNFTIGTAYMGSLDFAIRGLVAAALALLVGLASFSYSKKKFILYI